MTVKLATELEKAIEEVKNGPDPYVLIPPYGFIVLRGWYGSDSSIAQTARITTSSDDKNPRSLIRHLVRHFHTSPIENSHVDFEVSLPIFVERQWARHRTAGWNEVSGRYCELPAEQWEIPDHRYQYEPQEGSNRQGSWGLLDPLRRRFLKGRVKRFLSGAVNQYKLLRSEKVAPEISRVVLPLSTYTRKRWWVDMHNMMNFLRLREAEDAQAEIREYAKAAHTLLKARFPVLIEAFEDFRLYSMNFSRLDKLALGMILSGYSVEKALRVFDLKSEAKEFEIKFKNLIGE